MLEILNKPIFWHVYQGCLDAGFSYEDIILATDDGRIYQKALSLELNVLMTSTEYDRGTDRIYEVAKLLHWSSDHIVINVQGD